MSKEEDLFKMSDDRKRAEEPVVEKKEKHC